MQNTDQFDSYVGLILNIQNIQMEMMQILQTVQASVVQVQSDMNILSQKIGDAHGKIIVDPTSTTTSTAKNGTVVMELDEIIGDRSTIKYDMTEEKYHNIVKTESIKNFLKNQLQRYQLFNSCNSDEWKDILEVFHSDFLKNGTLLSKFSHDTILVLEEGAFDLYDNNVHKGVLKSPSVVWGMEILNDFNTGASAKAKGDCKLWSLKKNDVQHIFHYHRKNALQAKVQLLSNVMIDDHLVKNFINPHDLDTLALALKEETFKKDDVIIREEEKFDKLYIIKSGVVDLLINSQSLGKTLTAKDSFGEKFFVNGSSSATYKAISNEDVHVYQLSKQDYISVLGGRGREFTSSRNDDPATSDSVEYYFAEENQLEKEIISIAPSLRVNDFQVIKTLDGGYFRSTEIVNVRVRLGLEALPQKSFLLKNITSNKLLTNKHQSYNEAETLQLLHHPFIVKFYSEIQSNMSSYYLLEYLSGKAIYDLITDQSCLSEEKTRSCSAFIILALQHIHFKKIAHRNLKAENIAIVDTTTAAATTDTTDYNHENLKLKLINFSVAKRIPVGKAWTFVGTPEYLSPEVLLCTGHDWAVDYWALGVLLYEMCCGITPFASDTPFKIFDNILKNQIQFPKSFSPELVSFIQALLQTSQYLRLGRCSGGIKYIMNHTWFSSSSFDWQRFCAKHMTSNDKPPPQIITQNSFSTTDSEDKVPLESFLKKSQFLPQQRKISSAEELIGRRYSQELVSLASDNTSHNNNSIDANIRAIYAKSGADLKHMLESKRSLLESSIYSSTSKHKKSKTNYSFESFNLMSLDIDNLINNIKNWGDQELDPIVFKSPEIIDEYPESSNMKDSEEREALSLFCFPEGPRLRIIPKCAIHRAKRLGWMGSEADSYQIHVFHDEHSKENHGISITVKDEVHIPNIEALLRLRLEYRAGTKIASWVKRKHFFAREQKKRRVVGGGLDFLNNVQRVTSNVQSEFAISHRETTRQRLTNAISVMNNSKREKPSKLTDVQKEEEQFEKQIPFVTETSKLLAKESYEIMLKNKEMGIICIIEKCYTILGTNAENNSTLLCGLQQLVDIERKGKEQDPKLVRRLRHKILLGIRTLMGLETSKQEQQHKEDAGRLTSYVSKSFGTATYYSYEKKRYNEIQLAEDLPKVQFCLPPPLFAQEWGVFRLILRIKLRGLLTALQLLLVERSILVIGDSYEEVTISVKALVYLLEPYTWVSAFIPVLPTEMLAFVTSPVPFIVGVVAKSARHRLLIENNQYVKQENLNGLSIINLMSGELILSKEPVVQTIKEYIDITNEKLNRDNKLDCYEERVEYLAEAADSSIRNFKAFLHSGLTEEESQTLVSLKNTIVDYLLSLSGDLSRYRDGWKQYGVPTADDSEEIFFSADKVLLHLEKQYEYLRQFTNTQLLANYFEEKKKNETSNLSTRESIALFIVDWLSFKWWRHQRLQWHSSLGDS